MVNNLSQFSTISVSAARHTYPLSIGHGLLKDRAWLHQQIHAWTLFIITDNRVAPLYLDRFRSHFSDRACYTVIMEAGEAMKTLQHAEYLYDQLVNKRFPRDGCLIALGGGVIGDLVGFTASTYHRGVGLIQVPTSLLAQVDASIGGKTAVNHQKGKNLIGTFYAPEQVIIDTQTLETLPIREFRAGFAEVIKYAVLQGGNLFSMVSDFCHAHLAERSSEQESNTFGLLQKGKTALTEIITACCQVKADYVAADEQEQATRAFLNLGHTVGHALETMTHYQRWLHGEAVAIGLYCAALLSFRIGLCSRDFLCELDALIAAAQLPRRIPRSIDVAQLYQTMGQDKKIKNQRLRFILIRQWGACEIIDTVDKATVMDVMRQAYED